MLIHCDLYAFLDENGLLDMYVRNCKCSESYTLADGFKWDESPEGFDFWEKHNDKFKQRHMSTTQFMVEVK